MKGFIYIIKNTINSKVYIGQTKVSVEQRWKEHLRHTEYGDQLINRAMKKHGKDNFYIETLEICDLEVIDEREIYYIDLYDSTDKSKGYNVSIGGNTPRFKRKELSIAELKHLYLEDNWTLERIATKFGVTRYIITTELTNAGVSIKERHEPMRKFDKVNKDDLVKALEEAGSLRGAAKLLKVSYPFFRKSCIYHNIEYNSSKSIRH